MLPVAFCACCAGTTACCAPVLSLCALRTLVLLMNVPDLCRQALDKYKGCHWDPWNPRVEDRARRTLGRNASSKAKQAQQSKQKVTTRWAIEAVNELPGPTPASSSTQLCAGSHCDECESYRRDWAALCEALEAPDDSEASLTVRSHCALSLCALTVRSHCALSHCEPSHCELSHCVSSRTVSSRTV